MWQHDHAGSRGQSTTCVGVVELAVRGMLPKNSLGRKQLRKLKVYAGPDHPHRAQQPKPFKIDQVAQGATK